MVNSSHTNTRWWANWPWGQGRGGHLHLMFTQPHLERGQCKAIRTRNPSTILFPSSLAWGHRNQLSCSHCCPCQDHHIMINPESWVYMAQSTLDGVYIHVDLEREVISLKKSELCPLKTEQWNNRTGWELNNFIFASTTKSIIPVLHCIISERMAKYRSHPKRFKENTDLFLQFLNTHFAHPNASKIRYAIYWNVFCALLNNSKIFF